MGNLLHPLGKNDFFLPLDNSAVFMAATTGKRTPYMFRISCELDEPVHLPDLQAALAETAPRYPAFMTQLCPGLFWYYLDALKKPLQVQADTRYPVEYHRLKKWHRYLFRVRVYGPRIACEFHHILTDGTGAVEFLRSLVAAYLSRRGASCPDWRDIRRPDQTASPAEYEDAYAGLIRKDIPLPDPHPQAWRISGPRYPGPVYRITTGTVSVAASLKIAREKGVSLTALFAAVHLWTLQAVCEAENPSSFKAFSLEVPVNMRKIHTSATLRNFFLIIPVLIDRRLGHFSFEEILERVQYSIKLGLQRKELDRQIKRNVAGEAHPLARAVPLAIKNPVLRLVSRFVAIRYASGSLSNLQAVSMPPEFSSRIKRFDFIPPRNDSFGSCVGIITWQDTLSLTIGSRQVDRSFERFFFTKLVELGIPVMVESNI